jgi:hypothetical protein
MAGSLTRSLGAVIVAVVFFILSDAFLVFAFGAAVWRLLHGERALAAELIGSLAVAGSCLQRLDYCRFRIQA